MWFEVLMAALPLIVVAVLLVGFLWPATHAMPISWIVALIIGFFIWENPPDYLLGSSIVGVMTALEILWIVFGALVLLYTLMQAGAFDRINEGFAAVSDDRRVQIVLLAFFLSTFIEGAAGFGTPAAVVAPLLLALGFPALAAVIAALIGHIIAVTYGAVGTPIIVGIQTPLEIYEGTIEADGGMTVVEYSHNVAAWAATYHALAGFVMPLFAVGMVVYFFGPREERSIRPALEVWPLCLAAGIAFAIPYWLSAWFITAEFPSLIGSMVGAAIMLPLLRAGYFIPDTEWDFPPREQWPDHWVGTIEPGGEEVNAGAGASDMSLLKAWSPYIVLIVLLVITRVVEPISDVITNEELGVQVGDITLGVVIAWQDMFGYDLSADIAWVNVPGFWLILSALIAVGIYGMSGDQVKAAWAEAGEKLVSPFIALVFVIAMVQVMIQSGGAPGAPEYEVINGDPASMIELLAIVTANLTGFAYPSIAAVIGALAAIMVGSNTVSNITFGGFQFTAAHELDLPSQIIVGAQATGGAIGNLVAIHNVVAALATVGHVGQEGRVIRLNLIPLFYYAIVVGILTMLFVYVMPDVWPAVFDIY